MGPVPPSLAVGASSTEGCGTPCPEKSGYCTPETPIFGAACPSVVKSAAPEEDGKTCPDKSVEGPPVVGPVPPSVAVLAGRQKEVVHNFRIF